MQPVSEGCQNEHGRTRTLGSGADGSAYFPESDHLETVGGCGLWSVKR